MIFALLVLVFSCRETSSIDSTKREEVEVDNDTETWHSDLYPQDWTPEHTSPEGLFLHDFSYAGYRNGEETIPLITALTHFSVVDYGADPDTQSDSTMAFQDAIDAASIDGGVVWIPTGLYRIDGLLNIRHSNVIIAGEGPEKSQLWFRKDSAMSDQSSIRFQGEVIQGNDILLTQDAENRTQQLDVSSSEDVQVGDEDARTLTGREPRRCTRRRGASARRTSSC